MLLHGQATCCDQLHQNEQEKQVHLENINLLAMAENIFLALKGIKPVVSFLLDRYVQRFQATYQLLRKVKKKPALHLHSSQRSLAQLFAYPPPTLT